MGIFDFFSMIDNYEERKIDRFEEDGLIVDTCSVNDSDKPYETAVSHKSYYDGKWIIVQLYDTREEAQKGHNEWVKKMTHKKLPPKLTDVSTAEIADFCDIGDKKWRTKTKCSPAPVM